MKQFIAVLQFELGNYFKNKSFIVTTVLLGLVLILGISIPALFLFNNDGKESGSKEGTTQSSLLTIYDETGLFNDVAELETTISRTKWKIATSEKELKDLVDQQAVKAGFIVKDPQSFTFVIQNTQFSSRYKDSFEELLKQKNRQVYYEQNGYNAEELEELYAQAVTSSDLVLGKDSVKNYAYTYILVFVLYILILVYGQMIATSVTTEKSNRAIEVLVTSINSNSLIFGKVIAGAIASIVQVTFIMGSGLITYGIFREAWGNKLDFVFHIPTSVILTFVGFGLLGYLFYAFIYGALGALVSKTEDISKSSSFITIIYVASFLVAMMGLSQSDSMLIRICSFIPFTSSNAMLIRVAMGNVALWEIGLSIVILIISTAVVGLLASKIFRFGILMYGNPIKFTNAMGKITNQRKQS